MHPITEGRLAPILRRPILGRSKGASTKRLARRESVLPSPHYSLNTAEGNLPDRHIVAADPSQAGGPDGGYFFQVPGHAPSFCDVLPAPAPPASQRVAFMASRGFIKMPGCVANTFSTNSFQV